MTDARVVRLLRFLFGDPIDLDHYPVGIWLSACDERTGASAAAPLDARFELGCAQLYDSYVEAASRTFESLIVVTNDDIALRSLALLGQARACSLLRKYPVAHNLFGTAAAKLGPRDDLKPLAYAATLLKSMNASDWGRRDVADLSGVPPDCDPALWMLLEAHRVVAKSKASLRSGERAAGLCALETLMDQPEFASIAPIAQGRLYRIRGILLATSGNVPAARAQLECAIGIFRKIEFGLGEVQTALSLARITARADRALTAHYLDRARSILDATDAVGSYDQEHRQMYAERADLLSRIAQHCFAIGNFAEALQQHERDLTLLQTISSGPDALPRPLAYVHRHIGRVYLALDQPLKAAQYLEESCRLFRTVDDPINVFFSRELHCEAVLRAGGPCASAAAALGIEELQKLLGGAKDRDKEHGIVLNLRAQLMLHQNETGAHAVARAACEQLHRYHDYYYVRALLTAAEIWARMQDEIQARKCLLAAQRCASANEVEDLRRVAEARMRDLGMSAQEISQRHLSPLRQRCERTGHVTMNVVTMFADLRGFTATSTQIPVDSMALFIAEFARTTCKAVHRHGGDPVRFLGDCVMALFEVDPDNDRGELRAIKAAAEIHGLFQKHRETWAGSRPILGSLGLGFGIASGEVIAGKFGTEDLMEFSVIGCSVNLAARLQGVADDGEIVMCGDTEQVVRSSGCKHPPEPKRCDLKDLGTTRAFSMSVQSASSLSNRPPPDPLATDRKV